MITYHKGEGKFNSGRPSFFPNGGKQATDVLWVLVDAGLVPYFGLFFVPFYLLLSRGQFTG